MDNTDLRYGKEHFLLPGRNSLTVLEESIIACNSSFKARSEVNEKIWEAHTILQENCREEAITPANSYSIKLLEYLLKKTIDRYGEMGTTYIPSIEILTVIFHIYGSQILKKQGETASKIYDALSPWLLKDSDDEPDEAKMSYLYTLFKQIAQEAERDLNSTEDFEDNHTT